MCAIALMLVHQLTDFFSSRRLYEVQVQRPSLEVGGWGMVVGEYRNETNRLTSAQQRSNLQQLYDQRVKEKIFKLNL